MESQQVVPLVEEEPLPYVPPQNVPHGPEADVLAREKRVLSSRAPVVYHRPSETPVPALPTQMEAVPQPQVKALLRQVRFGPLLPDLEVEDVVCLSPPEQREPVEHPGKATQLPS